MDTRAAFLPGRPTASAALGLGLDPLELEAAIVALIDRDEVAEPQTRARLERVRIALELELGRVLDR